VASFKTIYRLFSSGLTFLGHTVVYFAVNAANTIRTQQEHERKSNHT